MNLMILKHIINLISGIIDTSGELWKDQRKTSVRILKQMGVGKNNLAENVQEEVNTFCDTLYDTIFKHNAGRRTVFVAPCMKT